MIGALLKRLYRRKDPVSFWRIQGAQIGENCEIYSSAFFGSEPYLISLGNHVRVNSGVQFVTHDGGVWVLRQKAQEGLLPEEMAQADLFGKIVVGSNVHIGTNAIIMPGVTIGNNCIIGCGAIVTRDIPDNSIAVGIPARVIEDIQTYYQKHEGEFVYTKAMPPKEKRDFLRHYFCEK